MERNVFQKLDTHWDHEPGNPGGETPPSTAGGTPAATEPRFMGSPALTGLKEKAQGATLGRRFP
jgi:hypothetical protein